jgi:hypothetical protein
LVEDTYSKSDALTGSSNTLLITKTTLTYNLLRQTYEVGLEMQMFKELGFDVSLCKNINDRLFLTPLQLKLFSFF